MLLAALMAIYGMTALLVVRTGRTAVANGRISSGTQRMLLWLFLALAGLVLRLTWSRLQGS